jgi:hypothetical protein
MTDLLQDPLGHEDRPSIRGENPPSSSVRKNTKAGQNPREVALRPRKNDKLVK